MCNDIFSIKITQPKVDFVPYIPLSQIYVHNHGK